MTSERVGEAVGPNNDWHDNSAFDSALLDLEMYRNLLTEINQQINNSRIAEKDNSVPHVQIGSTVLVRLGDLERKYVLGGDTEGDITKGIISSKSPIGSALLGAKKGQKIKITGPSGELMEYVVLDIY